MKSFKSLCQDVIEPSLSKLCDYVMTPSGSRLLKDPVMSNDYSCEYCTGTKNHTPLLDPATSPSRVWLCANAKCDVYTKKQHTSSMDIPPIPQRAQEWGLFCEINGIGDLNHTVKFEKIDQSDGKISYLLKFAQKPSGIIFMEGPPGSGKTYASMGVCELWTRKNKSCIFTTQKQMLVNWINSFNGYSNYPDMITNIKLLVVDDFGTAELTPGFLSFFMDLINSRMQWSDRGTIISTNLNDKKFSEYCGEALSDRIRTGQKFIFTDKTRRKPIQ